MKQIEQLPYHSNSEPFFETLQGLSHPVWLDSGYPHSKWGRYDILAANPSQRLVTYGDVTYHHQHGGVKKTTVPLFELLKPLCQTNNKFSHDFPFTHGLIGYCSYEFYQQTCGYLDHTVKESVLCPTAEFAWYDWAIVVDHQLQKSYLLRQAKISQAELKLLTTLKAKLFEQQKTPPGEIEIIKSWKNHLSKQDYERKFNVIKDHILKGNCYQINLTQQFSCELKANPWDIYRMIRPHMAAPFSAYLETSQGVILSFSPERLLRVNSSDVLTQPIKGTRARGKTTVEDQQLASALINSEKDRAENVMIVDLLRNDLSQTCHDVQVPQLCELISFKNVHHLLSSVTGVLDVNYHPLDVLQHCYPGGSVTGVPKLRAMNIINQLEPHARNAYCGCIGYINANAKLDMNLAIRTLVWNAPQLHAFSGGAIVADSEIDAEYQEVFDKISGFKNAIIESSL